MTAIDTQMPSSLPASVEQHPTGGMIQVHGDTIESITEQLLSHAARLNASDLFLGTNEQHVIVQVRQFAGGAAHAIRAS